MASIMPVLWEAYLGHLCTAMEGMSVIRKLCDASKSRCTFMHVMNYAAHMPSAELDICGA